MNVCELRNNFGVQPDAWQEPGRIIITELVVGYVGFWVDEILDVMESPNQGWGTPPPLIPRTIFTKTLFYNEQIHLYAEFESLYAIKHSGYLKSYIEQLNKIQHKKIEPSDGSKTKTTNQTNQTNQTNKSKTVLTGSEKNIKENSKSDNIESHSQQSLNQETSTQINPDPANSNNELQKTGTSNIVDSTEIKKPALITTKSASVHSSNRTFKSTDIKTSSHKDTATSKSTILEKPGLNTQLDNKKNTTLFNSQTHKKKSKNSDSKNQQQISNKLTRTPDKTTTAQISKTSPQTEANYTYQTTGTDKITTMTIAIVLIFLLLMVVYFLYPGNSTVEISSFEKPENDSINTNLKQSRSQQIDNSYKYNNNETHLVESVASVGNENLQIDNIIVNKTTLPIPALNTEQSRATIEPVIDDKLSNADNNSSLNNTQSNYTAEITKNPDGITITLHTPISKDSFSNLKTESIPKTVNSDNPEIEKINKTHPENTTKNQSTDYQIQIHSDKSQPTLKISDSMISKEIIHIVVKGDTLWHIAKFYVDDPYRYPELAQLSNIQNPDLIYPGDRVHIIQIFTTENND